MIICLQGKGIHETKTNIYTCSSLKGFIDSVQWLDITIINRIQTLMDMRMIFVGLLTYNLILYNWFKVKKNNAC